MSTTVSHRSMLAIATGSSPAFGCAGSILDSARQARTDVRLVLRRREGDRDGEPAARSCLGRELRVVSRGDRPDDRQSQSVVPVLVPAGAVEPLEGLEQTLDLIRWDRQAGVADREHGVVSVCRAGPHLNPAVGDVVLDRVVDQVRDQPLDERVIAGRRHGAFDRRVELEAFLGDGRLRALQCVFDEPRQGDRLPAPQAPPPPPPPPPRLASVSSASSIRSCSICSSSSSWPVARSVSALASGSASATWSRVRSSVRGVRSSCDALATNRRWASNDASSRASSSSSVSPSALNSSCGPSSASRSCRFPAEIVRAVAVIERTGRSTRPAANQPRTAEPTVVTAKTAHETVKSRAKSALRCAITSLPTCVAASSRRTGTARATVAPAPSMWTWAMSGLWPVSRTITAITVVPRRRNIPE